MSSRVGLQNMISMLYRFRFCESITFGFARWKRLKKPTLKCLEKALRPRRPSPVLPNSLAAKIAVKANLREWIHIFRMRCDIPAHPDMRVTMMPILVSMLDLYPVVFQPVYNWLSQKGALK